ncbi:hypothetical protein [Mesorhizobium sp. B2-4-7]|uniref:hypothetical protein n=1 Tax=Mesorhizobium sp. B2-4-7 TaxID=2589942 RepID=UPI0011289513|nr:hypothetical protein [Mesorhizobium sp. B2-4-7]TPL30179.1 hypothetical protein FJ946_02620 [Mesorhizobium sp. B2-4-7]
MDTAVETIRVKAVNSSNRGKVLRTHGGTVEVPSNGSIEADILPLTEEQIATYRDVHKVVITPVRAVTPRKPKGGKQPDLLTDRAALENAVAEAREALEAAQQRGDAAAIAEAQQAMDEAERAEAERALAAA